MKKILSILLAVVLVFALCVMPASAETNASEWKKGVGPGKINFTDEGTKISFDGGLQLFYYQNKVNLRDFTVKLKINAPTYDEEYYVAMVIGGNGKHTGAGGAQNFVLMWVRGTTLCINPQILHNGDGGIKPVSSNLQGVDLANDEITIHAKKVDDYTYSLDFNDGQLYYEYCIPENFNFVEDFNGEGCLGFGGSIGTSQADAHEFGAYNLVVKEISGVKMNGKDEPVSSNDGGSTDAGTNDGGSTDAGTNDGGINDGIISADPDTDTTDVTTEEKDNTLLIVIIICGVVLLLAVAAVVIVIVLKKKAQTPVEEEVAEETTEE